MSRITSLTVGIALASQLLAGARPAEAVQASGSLLLVPEPRQVNLGKTFDLVVYAQNTSTGEFPSSLEPTAATLEGPIVVKLACVGPDCTTRNSGDVRFVPVGGAGCASADPAVSGCAVDPSGDDVFVNITPPGLALPPDAIVPLATIRLRLGTEPRGVVTIRAASPIGGLVACLVPPNTACARGDAAGSTFVSPLSPAPLLCKNGCKTQIRFVGNASAPDQLRVVASLSAFTELLPSDPIALTLRSPAFDPIVSFSLPAGSLVRKGRSLLYRNSAAKKAGGVALVSLTPDPSVPNLYTVRIEGYSADLEARAILPDMTLQLSIGNDSFEVRREWARLARGWKTNLDE